jgi:hypothetical protein
LNKEEKGLGELNENHSPKLDWVICCSGWPLREEKGDTIKKARGKKLLRKRSSVETAKFKALLALRSPIFAPKFPLLPPSLPPFWPLIFSF